MDFTDVAINAFKFAYSLFPESELYVVHVLSGGTTRVSWRTTDFANDKSKKEVLKEELEKQIIYELSETTLPERIEVTLIEGEPAIPLIRDFIEQKEIEGMVLGTRDKYDLIDRWMGTFSLSLVKALHLPIYLVPRYASYKKFEKVIVASDYHFKNRQFIQQIKEWNKPYQAFIKFLHVQSGEENNFEEEKELIIEELVEKDKSLFGFEIETIHDKKISQSLLANAYNFGADLLIVVPDNQSFIASLLFKSISKELVLRSDIPLLFIHAKKRVAPDKFKNVIKEAENK